MRRRNPSLGGAQLCELVFRGIVAGSREVVRIFGRASSANRVL